MTQDDARRALRLRQGAGAPYDAVGAPAEDLLLARRGTAYFARQLGRLADGDLTPARRRVVARTALQARAMALAIKDLRERLTEEEKAWRADIDLAVTLPGHALRYLFDHAQIHLNVEWRDLPGSGWDMRACFDGWIDAPARETPSLRARTVWQSALDLDAGARVLDLPEAMRPRRGPAPAADRRAGRQ